MTEPLYPLTLQQNIAVERVVRDARWLEAGAVGQPQGTPDAPWARLMTIGTAFPKYRPMNPRNAAVFGYQPELPTTIVKFYGENLWGDVFLTIGDLSWRIDCRVDTQTLRQRLNFTLDYCRVTAFPGLWEFAWGSIQDIPAITCEPYLTSGAIRFLGGCVPMREAWRSTSSNGINYDTVKVIDSVPFIEGELKLGSMATCPRIGEKLYLSTGVWSCPAFTFRSL